MNEQMKDVITLKDEKVIFYGFDYLTEPKITIKIFGASLVIESGELPPLNNRHVFDLPDNKESDNPQLIQLLKEYCPNQRTAFLELDGSYYQMTQLNLDD